MFHVNWASHRALLVIALPMILSNITVPLLGLVDTAVVGHLSDAYYLGGVAVGSTIISFIFSLAGFLRMATTGVTAQACGSGSAKLQLEALVHGVCIALGIAFILLLVRPLIGHYGLMFSGGSDDVLHYGQVYFDIRIFSAPAALTNLVLLGWMLGMQNAKGPMWHLIFTNCINIALDVWFVYGLDMDVAGVAWASVIADYSGVAIGGYFVVRIMQKHGIVVDIDALKFWQQWQALKPLLLINRDIFLRALCLSLCIAFMTFQGAKLGDDIVAANAILMSFLMLVSFVLDGVAYAVEALVGKAYGNKDKTGLKQAVVDASMWSLVVGLFFTLLFVVWGDVLIGFMSDIEVVQITALEYLPWMMALPLISVWCFLLDGVCIGLTRAKDMRDSTFFAALLGFILPWAIAHYGFELANHSLWLAMCGLMALRGLFLYYRLFLKKSIALW